MSRTFPFTSVEQIVLQVTGIMPEGIIATKLTRTSLLSGPVSCDDALIMKESMVKKQS